MGFGDAMADATQRLDYPALLDFPAPQVRSYPPATMIAERTPTRPLCRDVWRRREAAAMACLRRIARTRRCFAGIDH
ncbi:MAG: hypothetical protein ACN6O9_24245 [Agrobacterium tumefaciens]